jgi:thioredoxin-dependent peroxiredoxin
MPDTLDTGDKAPDFTLPDESGTPVALKDFRGRSVVLFWYPKDMTPGCTQEACDFRDSYARLKKAGAALFGVSLDDGASHQKFIAKHELPFPLLSDTDAKVAKAYGVYKQKSMYGKTFWGIERSTFVIDPHGAIAAAFRKVKVEGHVDDVLKALGGKRARA